MTVVVIGSSGGGTATLGHTNAQNLLTTIHTELGRIGEQNRKEPGELEQGNSQHGLMYALFVACPVSMDSANPEKDSATLWTVGINLESNKQGMRESGVPIAPTDFHIVRYCNGTLKEVNKIAKELGERIISPRILADDSPIRGLVCISCDPQYVNYSVLSAAAKVGLPMTGSGGSSLSAAMTIHKGLSLVGNAGGSVATTTFTRAVSYCCALSLAWKQSYSSNSPDGKTSKPRIGSILDACLPSFLAVCVTCRFVTVYDHIFQSNQFLLQLQYQSLPSVCAVVAATSLSPEHGSTAVMAGVIASMSCYGSILAGLLAGWLVSVLLGRALFMCIKIGVPATMTNILVAGFVGASIAVFLSASHIVTFLSFVSDLVRTCVRSTPTIGSWDGRGFGFFFGCIFCYGSKVGWYHSIFLPVILIEMERGETSMWGSVDECVLVLVSAGICAGNVLISRGTCALTKRGLKVNIMCGDFIEVAYPYMERSKIVNLFGYLASGVSAEILYRSPKGSAMSSAYLPLPLSVILADDQYRIVSAMVSAFMISFIGMILSVAFQNKKTVKLSTGKKIE